MAWKLKKSSLFFRWNCFWNLVVAHGMKEPWNDLCWGNRTRLTITTLDIVPALLRFSNDQRYHCCTLFPPVETPNTSPSEVTPSPYIENIFHFRGQRPSPIVAGTELNQLLVLPAGVQSFRKPVQRHLKAHSLRISFFFYSITLMTC